MRKVDKKTLGEKRPLRPQDRRVVSDLDVERSGRKVTGVPTGLEPTRRIKSGYKEP